MEPVIGQPAGATVSVVTYAGFWKRFIAYLIDKFLIGVLACLILLPFIAILGLGALSDQDFDFSASAGLVIALIGAYFMAILLILVAEWLYHALMESRKGATLGKMALGIKVTDMNGNQVTFGRATGRYFGKILSGLIFCVGFLMAGFTQQKQALHDILAGCLVVNK
jgi:uncharacterized RDD family membrane protein YckC